MQWEIHALGDAAWVHYVINAVSSITGYGTLGAVGAMLGLLAMVFSGATSKGGPQLDMSWFVIAFVVFYAFFIPRADRVLITEVNPPSHLPTGRVYVVDNVPMGLAVVGSVVTKLGLALAKEYDTTFGSVDDTERVLTGAVGANIRRIADLRMMQELSFSDTSGTFALNRKNMMHYMAGCTVPGIAMGHVTFEQVMGGQSPSDMESLLDRIRYGQLVRRTEFYRDDGSVEILDCERAHERLVQQMTGPNGIGRGLGAALAERGRGETPDQALDRLSDTFTQFGYDAEALQTFAAASVMYAVHLDAIMGDSTNRHNQAMITMVEQAMAQRNMQFAAEESMFVALLRPSVSFFEALFYALAPVIAFLLPMGTMGLKLVGKYVLFAIWVVLYFPLLAIIGAFGDMQFAGAMEALRSVALTPYGTVMVLKEAQNTMGTVSLLAAAVPQLALAIIMGGPVAMSALAGRMQGGDMVDEKVAAPAAASNGAFLSQDASYKGNPGTGVVQNGAPLREFSLQGSLSETVSSSRAEQAQATEQFSTTLSNTLGKLRAAKESEGYQQDAQYKKAVDDAYARGVSLQRAITKQDSDQASNDAGTQDATTGGAGGGFGFNGNGGNTSASGSQTTTDTKGGRVGEGTVLKADASAADRAEHTRKLAESFAVGLAAADSHTADTTLSANDVASIQQQSADVYSKTLAYGESVAAANTLTSSLSFNDSQIHEMVNDGARALGYPDGGAALAAVQNALPPSAMGYFHSVRGELMSRDDFKGDPDAAALWRTVTDGRAHVPHEDRDELNAAAVTMAQLIAGKSVALPTGDPSENHGVADGVTLGSAKAEVLKAGLPGPGITNEDVTSRMNDIKGRNDGLTEDSTSEVSAVEAEREGSPDGFLPATDSQKETYIGSGATLVEDHIEAKKDRVHETLANRDGAGAAVADIVSMSQGAVEAFGIGLGALVMHGGRPVATTEGQIATAEEQVRHLREEVDSQYPRESWTDEQRDAFAMQRAVHAGVPLTAEQYAFAEEHLTAEMKAEAFRFSGDVTLKLRDAADDMPEGVPEEIANRVENR